MPTNKTDVHRGGSQCRGAVDRIIQSAKRLLRVGRARPVLRRTRVQVPEGVAMGKAILDVSNLLCASEVVIVVV